MCAVDLTDSKNEGSPPYLFLTSLYDLRLSIAASIFRLTTVFGLFWIMLKTSDLPVALFAFFKSLTQTYGFYCYIYLYLVPLAFTYITCKSIADAISKLRQLPLHQFL